MPTVREIEQALFRLAPKEGAMDWDNVGQLLGDPEAEVRRVLVALDITEAVADEAIAENCQLIVSHHPVMNCKWLPVQTVRQDTPQGHLLLKILRSGLSAICMHTNLDVAPGGVNDALAAGYTDEAGDVYYYLFHSYYGQKDKDAAFLIKAKDALLAGIEKFPKNEKILDGLMQLYTSEEGVGDPADLVGMIDKSLESDPDNVDLWFGRGRVFYKLKNYDETINSFKKVVELKPDLYEGNYYLGLFYTVKADAMNTEMGQKNYRSQSEYDADLKEVNVVYMAALPYFEKAHQLKPDDVDTVDYIKSISFRLRDEPGMMDKYNEYNELLKKMTGSHIPSPAFAVSVPGAFWRRGGGRQARSAIRRSRFEAPAAPLRLFGALLFPYTLPRVSEAELSYRTLVIK